MTATKQFLLFLTIGLLSAGVNFSTFFLMWQVAHLNYQLAVSIAYILAVSVHFFGNRSLTFQSQDQHMLSQLKKYLLLLLINYLITLATVTFFVSKLHFSPYLGLITAIGLTVLIGFTLCQQYIFKAVT